MPHKHTEAQRLFVWLVTSHYFYTPNQTSSSASLGLLYKCGCKEAVCSPWIFLQPSQHNLRFSSRSRRHTRLISQDAADLSAKSRIKIKTTVKSSAASRGNVSAIIKWITAFSFQAGNELSHVLFMHNKVSSEKMNVWLMLSSNSTVFMVTFRSSTVFFSHSTLKIKEQCFQNTGVRNKNWLTSFCRWCKTMQWTKTWLTDPVETDRCVTDPAGWC